MLQPQLSIWENVIALLAEGKIRVAPLAGRIAPLKVWQGCIEDMHTRQIVKAVLKPQES